MRWFSSMMRWFAGESAEAEASVEVGAADEHDDEHDHDDHADDDQADDGGDGGDGGDDD